MPYYTNPQFLTNWHYILLTYYFKFRIGRNSKRIEPRLAAILEYKRKGIKSISLRIKESKIFDIF